MYLFKDYKKIDHLAIAVTDLDAAIKYHQDVLGFELDSIRETKGKLTSMRSAVMASEEFSVVLLVSNSEGSQIERYIEQYGTGVQHVAFQVEGIENVYEELQKKGMEFSTEILCSAGLKQVFSKRDANTGMMYEFIERDGNFSFEDSNINRLFEQLESGESY
ncbi:glyoxalase [Pseudoalteromonas rubra]|uniref:Glyoxalase n=1 Tax=Pseudoalteromonas rubra TaxID=43658 RepID=A0A5S3WP73_9GAMM|nr:VOC family protein [Pseudoalteromonas rubra]TMP29960.1 glyoxalase [Pseudoalteromonas rubra]TMP32188.1 glyoxalase [Pseudoalteromonas rubra]